MGRGVIMKRKVLFTDGMSSDFLLIITDAPKTDIEEYCRWHVDQKYNFFSDKVVGEINEAICENMYMFDVAKTNKFYSCNDNMFSRDNSAKNIEGLLLTVKRQFGGE